MIGRELVRMRMRLGASHIDGTMKNKEGLKVEGGLFMYPLN